MTNNKSEVLSIDERKARRKAINKEAGRRRKLENWYRKYCKEEAEEAGLIINRPWPPTS